MKTQIMGGPNMKNFERKFGILRRRLDDMGYRQMLPMEAVPLVERLLNDFMQTTESYMRCKDKADENEKTKCMLEASVEPYREENGKLSQENARLHKRMLRLEEKHHEEELDAKLELRKLRKRFDEMRFMVESYESHMRDMEATERGLREEISKYTSKKARLSDMQNIDLPITLEPQPIKERREPVVQDPYLVDLVKVYDARIAQLESRITEDEALRKKLETELESAKCKVAAREKEIDRLEEILRHGINFDDMSAKASEKEKNLMARQMSLQVEYLEKTVIDLEKRLEEALEKQHVAMRKAVEESKKKEGLKKEVKELDKLSFKAEKDRVRVVQAALDKCAEVEEECRKKHETVENLKSNIGELKATKSGLEKDIREICGEKEDLIKLMDSLQRDRDRLMEKINRLTENERDLLSELNRLTSRSQDLSSTRKGYMFETASTCGSEDDRKYLTDISKSLSSLKTKTGRFETGESVSRLKREVTSLRYENTQLQAERDRLRRMLGLPGAGSPVNGVVPLSEAKTKDRYSPVEQETRPNVMRSTTKHPFSGFTVTTNIEVSKSGRSIPVSSLTTTIPRDTPAVRTQAVGGEQTIVTGGSSSATKPSVLESTERLANAAEPSALVSPPRASPNATADSGFDYRCSASSDHRITDSQENMRGEMKGSERNFESHTGRSYAGVPSKNVAWCDEIIPTSGRFRADLDDAKAMIDALKEELNACQRERDSLRQEKFDMKFLNDTLLSDLERQKKANERLEEDNRIQYKIATESGPPSIATQAMIKRLEREKQNLQTEVTALKLDRDRLRDRLKVASDAARTERMQSQNQTEALKLKIASLERNHGEILSREASQKSMTNNFRDQVMSLQRELTITRTELSQQRAAANQLKLLCEEKERRVEKLEVEGVGLHRQLASAEKKLETCCKENGALKAEMQTLQGQLARTRSFVDTVSKEKDSLSNQLDDRDVAIDKERSERAKLMDEIRKLQSTLSSTQSTLDKTLAECDSREVELNSVRRHMQQLTKELEAANMSRQGAFQEGKRLQGDLTTAITDIRSIKQELDKCKAENEDLRSQIQDYVNEVKRFEEVLAMKEDERNGLLEQYKNLTVEASSLEVEKSRLESTSKNLKILLVAKETELDSTKGTMDALDRELRDQRASKLGANVQLADCKSKLEQAERELKQMSAEKASTEGDLNAVRELCTQLDLAKEQLTVQLSSVEKEKLRLLARVSDLEATVDQTRNEAQNRRKEVEYLEQQLGVRRDTELVSHRQHRDLKDELESLQTELAAMKTKLEMKAADVDHYRKESHDLQVEVEQMRLELTRARGEKRELCDELERVRRRMGTPFLSTATPMDLSPVPAAYSFSPVSVPLPQIGSDTDDDFVIKSTVRITKDHLDDDDDDDDDLRRLDLRPRTGSP